MAKMRTFGLEFSICLVLIGWHTSFTPADLGMTVYKLVCVCKMIACEIDIAAFCGKNPLIIRMICMAVISLMVKLWKCLEIWAYTIHHWSLEHLSVFPVVHYLWSTHPSRLWNKHLCNVCKLLIVSRPILRKKNHYKSLMRVSYKYLFMSSQTGCILYRVIYTKFFQNLCWLELIDPCILSIL